MEEDQKICIQHFDVKKLNKSENLLSRHQGIQIRDLIKQELAKLPTGGILILDFRNIVYATTACLIEILKVYNELTGEEFHDKYMIIKLQNSNCEFKDCLKLALKEKNIVILYLDENDDWKILGELTKAQKDTFDVIKQKKEVTSGEISRIFGIPVNAASNRLRNLYGMGLVKRDEKILSSTGGRQFVYRDFACNQNIDV